MHLRVFIASLITCTSLLPAIALTPAKGPKHCTTTAALLNYLHSIEGTKTLSATMATVNWNINEAQWVHHHMGKWPAMAGFDYIHHVYSTPGGWIDYSDTSVLEQWHNQGGLITIGWHWNVPANSGVAGKYAFYWGNEKDDDHTNFNVRKIFDPSSSEYQLMINDIDKIASYLKPLKEKDIPVLWRPLHEAGGQWFWWGRDPEGCKELWRVMYERFQAAGLDNLIWVWTSAASWGMPYSDGYRWYPGDEYVDIVGIDVYNEYNTSKIFTDYYSMLRQQSPDKLTAMTEMGNVATMGQQWTAGAKWLYFMPWYDYARTNNTGSSAFNSTDHSSANVAWWNEAFSHDYVLTRDALKADMATAITEVENNSESRTSGIFTLSGQRMEHPGKGIYIIDGKKRVFR